MRLLKTKVLLLFLAAVFLAACQQGCAPGQRGKVSDAYLLMESYLQAYKAKRLEVDGTPMAEKLDTKVWPIVEQAKAALDTWEEASAGDSTWNAKKMSYAKLSSQMVALMIEYGVIEIVKEE